MRISDWSSDVCSSDLETLKEYNMLGRQVPDVVLKTRVRDESIGGDNPFRWQDMRTGDLFRNKRVVVFSLPGAFTPRSEERRVGKEGVSQCRSRGSPEH